MMFDETVGRRAVLSWALPVLFASLLVTSPAAAQAVADSDPAEVHGQIRGGPLVVHSPDLGYAAGVTASALFGWKVLDLGIDVALETQLLGYSRMAGGVTGGFELVISDAFELDLLGALGGACYSGIESGLLSGPGASGCVAYVGGRAGVAWTVDRRKHSRASVGAWALYTTESHEVSTYTYSGWFNSQSRSARVGTERVGGILGATITFE